MPALTLRSVQRALVRLNEAGLIDRHGVTDPCYSLNYEKIIRQPINGTLLENDNRPTSSFNFVLLEWLLSNNGQDLANLFFGSEMPITPPQADNKEGVGTPNH